MSGAALAAERAALARTLRAVGPDAPTLIPGWRAADLAAHVAATERQRGLPTFVGRQLVARYGLRLNDRFQALLDFDRRRFHRHGFDWAVTRLERDGPGLLAKESVLPVSLFEIFVHHEDVLRANDVPRPTPPPPLEPTIDWLLRYQRTLLGEVGVRVGLPGGRSVGGGPEAPALAVSGPPGEVVLWLAGRGGVAEVDVVADGPAAEAVAARLAV